MIDGARARHRGESIGPPALDRDAAADPDAHVRRILDGGSAALGIDPAALRRRAERGEALVGHIRRCGGNGRRRDDPTPPAFDRAFLAAHDTASIRAGVWHMLDDERPTMPHIRGVPTEAETRAIAAFLRDQPQRP